MAMQQNYVQPLGRADGAGGAGPGGFALSSGSYQVPGSRVSGLDPGSLPKPNPWQEPFATPSLQSGENNVPGFISERVITINMVCAAQPDTGWTKEYFPGKIVLTRRASRALTYNDMTIVYTLDQANTYFRIMYEQATGTAGYRARREIGGHDDRRNGTLPGGGGLDDTGGGTVDGGMVLTDIDVDAAHRDSIRGWLQPSGQVGLTEREAQQMGIPHSDMLEAEEPESYLYARRILKHFAYAGVIRAVSSRYAQTPVLSVQIGGPHMEVANYWGSKANVLGDVGLILKRYQNPQDKTWHEFQLVPWQGVREETDEDGFTYISMRSSAEPSAKDKMYYRYDHTDPHAAGRKDYGVYIHVGLIMGLNGQVGENFSSREMAGLGQGGGFRAGKNTARSAIAFKERSAHSLIVAMKRPAPKFPRTRHDGGY